MKPNKPYVESMNELKASLVNVYRSAVYGLLSVAYRDEPQEEDIDQFSASMRSLWNTIEIAAITFWVFAGIYTVLWFAVRMVEK